MEHIFIDANIFVGLYELGKDTVKEMEMLVTLVRTDEAKLWLPEQVKREFWKNREKQIFGFIDEFEKKTKMPAAPMLLREHSDFTEINELFRSMESKTQDLCKKLRKDVEEEVTAADFIIRKLFDSAEPIDTDEKELFRQAHRRSLCHTPPGKGADIGDRLNWVGLLSYLPENSNLQIIADDADYISKSSNRIHPYLKKEWANKNGGDVTLWGRISKFLANQFPEAENAMGLERDIHIERLETSGSFAKTHKVIEGIKTQSNFDELQVKRVVAALRSNDQVNWILSDDDVKEFVRKLIKDYGAMIPEDDREYLSEKAELNIDED